MSIIIPINIVKVYHNLVLALYIKGLVLKAVIAVSVIFITVSKWVKALLTSSILIEVTLSSVRSLKVVK